MLSGVPLFGDLCQRLLQRSGDGRLLPAKAQFHPALWSSEDAFRFASMQLNQIKIFPAMWDWLLELPALSVFAMPGWRQGQQRTSRPFTSRLTKLCTEAVQLKGMDSLDQLVHRLSASSTSAASSPSQQSFSSPGTSNSTSPYFTATSGHSSTSPTTSLGIELSATPGPASPLTTTATTTPSLASCCRGSNKDWLLELEAALSARASPPPLPPPWQVGQVGQPASEQRPPPPPPTALLRKLCAEAMVRKGMDSLEQSNQLSGSAPAAAFAPLQQLFPSPSTSTSTSPYFIAHSSTLLSCSSSSSPLKTATASASATSAVTSATTSLASCRKSSNKVTKDSCGAPLLSTSPPFLDASSGQIAAAAAVVAAASSASSSSSSSSASASEIPVAPARMHLPLALAVQLGIPDEEEEEQEEQEDKRQYAKEEEKGKGRGNTEGWLGSGGRAGRALHWLNRSLLEDFNQVPGPDAGNSTNAI
mmetsp:Transcript_5174/g.12365  ORF Transcript_5174/g.12365 Transcript_5174/m.12365 type:complete len:476 (+) Transcript_5174:1954-3381(+)